MARVLAALEGAAGDGAVALETAAAAEAEAEALEEPQPGAKKQRLLADEEQPPAAVTAPVDEAAVA